ncbi:MAG TPA: SRPBCC family protein [Cellulomonas sp.]
MAGPDHLTPRTRSLGRTRSPATERAESVGLPPAVVFAAWAAPATWSEWDPEVRSVTFDGPATLGATGRLRPRSGPASSFTITELRPDRVFTNTGRLPGARLVFEHVVAPSGAGSTVTVTVGLQGALAPLLARLMRRGMTDAARSSVEGLLGHLDAR